MPLAFGDVGGYPGLGQNLPQYVQGANPFMYRDEALKHIYKGMQGPFNEDWQTQETSRQADQLAFSEGQAQEQLRNDAASRGMVNTDPGVQAEQRRISDTRRRATIGMGGDVRRGATMANYTGGMGAARTLLDQGLAFGSGNSAGATVQGYGGFGFKYPKPQTAAPKAPGAFSMNTGSYQVRK